LIALISSPKRTTAAAMCLSAIVASLFLPLPAATADATVIGRGTDISNSSCDADVAVIGLRGSGQDKKDTYKKLNSWTNWGVDAYEAFQGWPAQSEGKLATDQIEGFSNEVATAAFGLRQRFPDSLKMTYIPVEYPAIGIGRASIDQVGYVKSFQDGAAKLKDTVDGLVSNCGDRLKIAIIGFSQGSQATHEALSLISPENRKHIASVVLIADPARDPDDKTALNYNEGNDVTGEPLIRGSGLYSQNRQLLTPFMPEAKKLPEDLKGKILSVCQNSDPICGFRQGLPIPAVGQYIPALAGLPIHGTAYQDKGRSNLYDIPADWAHDRVADALLEKGSTAHSSTPNVYEKLSETVKCPSVNFISAGSNDDSKTGGKPAQAGGGGMLFGLGADLPATYLWAVKDHAPGTSIGIKWIDYPAENPSGILDSTSGNEDYNMSVKTGVQSVLKTVDDMQKECPDSAIILFGDEQGAQVMHEASIQLVKAGKADKLKAVWLVSDPTRTGDDPVVKEYVGDPTSSVQLVHGEPLSSKGGYLKPYAQKNGTAGFPAELNGKVISVCFTGDSMCNPQPDTKAEDVGSFGNYISFSGLWQEPAKWVADRLR
jgi:hypothetical protein